MNPYEVLEIAPGAPPEEIKAAYHRMAKQWHPDRFTGEAKVDAERRFRMLAEAFNLLKDAPPAPRREEAPAPRREEASARPQAEAPPAKSHTQPIQLSDGPQERPVQVKTAEDWFKDAKTALEEKDSGRALALILYALRMDGERAEFHAFHGKVLEVTGGNARVKVQALETAIRLNPKDVESMIILAQTFQNLGMQARATRLWGTVHALAPNHVIFNPAPAKGSGSQARAKEQLGGLGEQLSVKVAELRVALGRIFHRG